MRQRSIGLTFLLLGFIIANFGLGGLLTALFLWIIGTGLFARSFL